ncbi:DNA polymerase III subunit alpha [Burkholderia cepacia]|uniref:DNA polymerase III subunit alpha n=1 Tax=Burkholderia cepacia TaxID=292 RepID=UPI0015769109|nr:DNA polymerase III subunit alpha [Burkholderia cepacia]
MSVSTSLQRHFLNARSDFSMGQSILQVDKMVERAKELGYASLALVDTMTVSNMVTFAGKAQKAGIKPIIGCTLRVYEDPTYRKPAKSSGEAEKPNPFFMVKAYVKNDNGMRSLMKLLSKANSAEYFYYHSRIGLQELYELEDCIISTGDFYGLFHYPKYEEVLVNLFQRMPVFAELVPLNTPLYRTINQRATEMIDKHGMNAILSWPALYPSEEHADTLDVMRVVIEARDVKMGDRRVMRPHARDFCMKPMTDIVIAARELNLPVMHAMKGNQALADACTYEFKKLDPCLPKMADDEFKALMEACAVGWRQRFSAPVLGHKPDASELPAYKQRLAYELDTLRKLGFSGYFLLTQHIVQWAKQAGIIVGPGRGSVGGSLVAYLMGITDVDPIRFDLLFERFINPERLDLPDADLDFMSKRRHEVIEYIVEHFGRENVAGISNYNTLGAASSLRDCGRVHDLSPFDYACSKQMESTHGVSASLEESAAVVPEIDKFRNKFPEVWKHAVNLEGAARGLGQHAAGVVVAGEPIVNRAVVETRTGGPVCNWDKRSVEDWGLIKMDILGLTNLDVLKLASDYIKERHGKAIDLLKLSLDDAKVMKAFGQGDTTGVFQFESPGMRRILREMALAGDVTFDDLVAAVALYRPGPLDAGLCDDYIAIKQGKKHPYYEHPNMAPALKDTFGVIVYQEQVMQVARDVAGFTLAQADHLRKAMGKKDKEKMAEMREKFVSGCVSVSGMDERAAGMLWDKIEVFAGYAFNKSHSVEYAVISFWTMWLKVYFPAEFFAASLTELDKEEKRELLVTEARRMNIQVLPPDINHSSARVEIVGEDKLYAPFQALKGMSENAAGYVVDARAKWGRSFESRTDFDAALKSAGYTGRHINSAVKEKLVRIGAFAECEGDRVTAMHPDRQKDRIELLPGFAVETVKADRALNAEKLALLQIVRLAEETRSCDKCSLSGGCHPMPRVGKTPKFMVVADNPNWQEEKAGKLLEGDNAAMLINALKEAGLSPQDGYFTALVKSGKPKDQKTLKNEQINACSEFLQRELDILKPPVIVTLGSNSARFFAPSVKGATAELAGKVVYDPKRDASIVFGINPAQIYHDPGKYSVLQTVAAKTAELIS